MSEDFLHYIWKYKLFNLHQLTSQSGEEIRIYSEGLHNHNAGPDFSDAKIQIGHLIWAGNVEIHVNSSDWYTHHHQKDPLYQKVILHVVWNDNKSVTDTLGHVIPTLVLNGRVSKSLLEKYKQLNLSRNRIMCSDSLQSVNPFEITTWLQRLLIERLERKILDFQEVFSTSKGDWEQTFFNVLCKNMGFKTNAAAMMALSRQLNFKILLKNADDLFKLESLLFGVAGLLEGPFKEEYPQRLQQEFIHQKHKYSLDAIPKDLWKFGRVRPSGFPTIRLAQLANLIHTQGNLFDRYVRNFEIIGSKKSLQMKVSDYWQTHYRMDIKSVKRMKVMGMKSVENILINTISPMLFFYGKAIGDANYQSLTIDLLENLPAENNFIIRNWSQNNIFVQRASDSQSLLELTNRYCTLKKCLNCGIGKQVLNS